MTAVKQGQSVIFHISDHCPANELERNIQLKIVQIPMKRLHRYHVTQSIQSNNILL